MTEIQTQKTVIQQATREDFSNIWPTFQAVIQGGDTYTYPSDLTQEAAKELWFDGEKQIYITVIDAQVAGSYYLRPNQLGRGKHVSNAGFMVNPTFRGQGIGKQMGLHAIETAREAGYLAMQFNSVVSTNITAVKLWQSLGFEVIGTVPKGFNHQTLGLVDLFIMHRFLN